MVKDRVVTESTSRGELGHANKQNLNHLVHANKLAYLCVCPRALSCVL